MKRIEQKLKDASGNMVFSLHNSKQHKIKTHPLNESLGDIFLPKRKTGFKRIRFI